MATAKDLSERVLEIVQETPGCDLEDLAAKCPEVTWNQVFLTLDRLSRSGRVVLKQSGPGHYSVMALPAGPSSGTQVTHHS